MSAGHSDENAVEPLRLTNDEKEAARAWLYAHNGDQGGGLGGLWRMVEDIVAERVRQALHDAWLAVHIRRFDGDYDAKPGDLPEYAEQVKPDNIYNGTRRAEAHIAEVSARYGVGYQALHDSRVPLNRVLPGTERDR